MKLQHKKKRPLSRDKQTFRDDRLFVIATEDTHAPEQYFRLLRNPRVRIAVLPSEDGRSAPAHVMARLKAFAEQYELEPDDQLWLMLDTDHWVAANHIATFRAVCEQAVSKGYHLAHSNPCFELWLLLHQEELVHRPVSSFNN